MNGLLQQVLTAPTWAVLGTVALLVFIEDALFVGFVFPGETAAILGGVAASVGHAPLPAVFAVVIAAAILGDSVGYHVGRHFGPRILQSKILDRRRQRLDEAQDFLARRGGAAVILGRWIAFFRAVMPALAGAARMPYPRFLAYNVAGGVIWGATVVTLGYVAGQAIARSKPLGRYAGLLIPAIVTIGLAVWLIKRRRAEAHAEAAAVQRGRSDARADSKTPR